MNNAELIDMCETVSGRDGDTFVGIRIADGNIRVRFPLGYELGKDSDVLRKDIIVLLKVLETFDYRKQDADQQEAYEGENSLPISAYLGVLQYYFTFGTYSETEVRYHKAQKGKINWTKTVKREKPHFTDSGAVYIDFIVKDSRANNDSLIAQIFKYCVYVSFQKIGWLYTKSSYPKPAVRFNQKNFSAAVKKAMNETFNDTKRRLFSDMLKIINSADSTDADTGIKTYGTDSFQYVWEQMIDRAFGIKNKEKYFPKSSWVLNDCRKQNHCLEPDTVMLHNGEVYILDAKYYRYGCTKIPAHLPETSSIQKQITYGEFTEKIDENSSNEIFNAFIMPFCSAEKLFGSPEILQSIGYAESDWRAGSLHYDRIAGILLDTKFIMKNYLHCEKLAGMLRTAIKDTVI